MSQQIKISLQEVSDLAIMLRKTSLDMYDVLSFTKQEMNKLDGVWESESSITIRERFNIFSNKFDELKNVIDSYANFLDKTVSSYDSLETTINLNASNFN